MRLSLTLSVTDNGDGTSLVVVRTGGETATANCENAELLTGQTVTIFFDEPGPGIRPSPGRRRAAINRQERERAEELGGHRQTGSGSVRGLKADGRVFGKYRIENKATTTKAYRLELADLLKLRSECAGLEVPVFEVEFQEKATLRAIDRWALIPWDIFRKRISADTQADDNR